MRSAIAVQARPACAALPSARTASSRAAPRIEFGCARRPVATRRRGWRPRQPIGRTPMCSFRRFQGVERLGAACGDLCRRRLQSRMFGLGCLQPCGQFADPAAGIGGALRPIGALRRDRRAARRAGGMFADQSFALGSRRGIGCPGGGQCGARGLDGVAQRREIRERPLRIVGQPERNPHVLALRRQARHLRVDGGQPWSRPPSPAHAGADARGAHVPGAAPRPSVPRGRASRPPSPPGRSRLRPRPQPARLPPHHAPPPSRVAAPTIGYAAAGVQRPRWVCLPGWCSHPSARPRLRGTPAFVRAASPGCAPSPAVSSSTSPICDRARASAGGPCTKPGKRRCSGRQLGGRVERQQFPPMSRGVTVGSRGQFLAEAAPSAVSSPAGTLSASTIGGQRSSSFTARTSPSARASAPSRAATESAAA